MAFSKSKTATIELLDQYFTTAFSAPEGIPKLRELILSLAMQGQLVPQNPNDKPAKELLKDIEAEKQRLIKEGKIKKSKPLPDITPDEIPYDIPDSWEWVRLGDIGNIFNGNSINSKIKETKYKDVIGLPYIATKDIGYGFEKVDYENGIFIPKNEDKFKIAHNGSILICSEGGSAGKKCAFIDRDICFGNKLFANELFANISSKFILCIYLTPFFKVLFTKSMTGIIGGISINKFIQLLIPLPPLEEQRRIVERIESLMDKCDRLEKLQNEREDKRLKIQLAVSDKLLNAPDKPTFDEAWQFIEENFETIYSVKENVKQLRQMILQLAVMGKLVPQDAKDRSARELLRDIEAEKQRLIKEKKLKIGKITKESKNVNKHLVLPDSWLWVKGIDLFFITKLAGFEYTEYMNLSDYGDIPVIRAQNVKPFRLNLENIKYIDLKTSELLERCALNKKCLLVTFIGAGIGDVALFDLDTRWHLAPNVAKMELFPNCEKLLDLRYFQYFLNSPLGKKEIFKHLKSTAQPSISMGTIRDIDYPLPPLEEQKRIVDKVDKMMKLCDELEEKITAQTDTQTKLLNAIIAQI